MSRDALVVGINHYQHLPGLNAPARDAESVAQCFERFGECRVLRLPEVICDHKPAINHQGLITTQMLETALIRLFKPAGKTVPQMAVFYYSGHGLQRHAGIQEGYLATSDANPAAGHYGLSLQWLRRLLQDSPVHQRVIILDCCNSGELFNVLEADPGAKAGTDRLFMAASREYEEAYESLAGSHSVFTEALLSGLNPHKAKGGVVNGHSLTDQVNHQMKGELQQPLFENSGGEIILTRASGIAQAMQPATATTLDRLQSLRYRFCPFPGLAPFEPSHADLFFGREAITQSLVERVQITPFCALVGASGIGKTSILQAGLIAHLAAPRPAPDLQWDVRYLSLGTAPLQNLATAFVDPQATGLQRAEQLRQAESFLRRGGEGLLQLVQATAGVSHGSPTRTVLVIDQFEALFACTPAAERDRQIVIDSLVTAAQQHHVPLHVVISLRSSALDQLDLFPSLRELVKAHGLVVPAMTYDQLKSTILGPLDQVGLGYDTNLIYTLLLDLMESPGNLALLQMTLKALWQSREAVSDQTAPRLTLDTYAAMGGIRRLLEQHANQVVETLTQTEQAIARRIFLSLCELGDGTALTRRQVQLPELITATMPQDHVNAVIDKLVDQRLLVTHCPLAQTTSNPLDPDATVLIPGPGGNGPEPSSAIVANMMRAIGGAAPRPGSPIIPSIDIAHEALVRTWPLLQTWLQEAQPLLKRQRTIEAMAQEWRQNQCPSHPDYFFTKSRLLEAKIFQTNHGDWLSLQATDYLAACQDYARRSNRKLYLMRLLIPLSMVTGMATAYGHSLLTQPQAQITTAVAPLQTDMGPAFHLVAPESPIPPGLSTGGIGSPQAGMAGTEMLHRASTRLSTSPNGLQPINFQGTGGQMPELVTVLRQSQQATQAWQPKPQQMSMPSATTPLSGQTNQATYPPVNQVVEPVAQWISPEDPDLVIQIWCTRSGAESTCFTSTAKKD
ncbi:caspase family protein [Nodosilinea sp. P-1105]|uniref:nSTAND1 domain-containing NTPase n=1 Tax=Nodosilinea sp. P-1105 TaxID=2546229 RepID=UPI00146A945A|nr:caspase family protein [Nodosilinea sp. P-1105]NMF83729.1 hypothetical protein [Nodosilinea sp. P-1105]